MNYPEVFWDSIHKIYIGDGLHPWCFLRFRFKDVSSESRFELLCVYNTCRSVLIYLGLSIDSKYNIIIVWQFSTKVDFIHFLYNICIFLHF
jgi:hypothetical protein